MKIEQKKECVFFIDLSSIRDFVNDDSSTFESSHSPGSFFFILFERTILVFAQDVFFFLLNSFPKISRFLFGFNSFC